MRAWDHIRTSLAVAFVSLGEVAALGQAPELILRSISRIPEPVLLSIHPDTTTWVLLQSSSNLSTWYQVANVLTTNSIVPFVDCPSSNAPVRFYRVRWPQDGAFSARRDQ